MSSTVAEAGVTAHDHGGGEDEPDRVNIVIKSLRKRCDGLASRTASGRFVALSWQQHHCGVSSRVGPVNAVVLSAAQRHSRRGS
jgi:hypothetical protein